MLCVVLATAKISAIVYSLTADAKKEFVQEDQDSEKEETTKKPVEASGEKKFTIFNSRYSHQVLIAIQTFHNIIYLNNYQSSFYGLITTPPPDRFALISTHNHFITVIKSNIL